MKKVIEAYSSHPIDQFTVYWLPVCGQGDFDYCHRLKDGQPTQTICLRSIATPVSSCQKVTVTIEDGR